MKKAAKKAAPKKAVKKTAPRRPAAKSQDAFNKKRRAAKQLALPLKQPPIPAQPLSKAAAEAANKERKIAGMRKRGDLPPSNPKAGTLTTKQRKPGKRAMAAASAAQAELLAPPAPEPAAPAVTPSARPVDTSKPVAAPTILPHPPKNEPYLAVTYQRQTAIVLSRGARVRFIPFCDNGLYILTQDAHSLDAEYSPTDYPVARAAKIYYDALKFFQHDEVTKSTLAQLAGIATAVKPQVPTDIVLTQELDMTKVTKTAAKKDAGAVAKLDKTPPAAAKKAAAKKAATKAPTTAAAKKAPAKAAASAPEQGRKRTPFTDDMKITVLAKTNPYREGSKAFKTLEYLRKCKTIAAARAGAKKAGASLDYLSYASRDGHISIA